jgi:hypothetical protein
VVVKVKQRREAESHTERLVKTFEELGHKVTKVNGKPRPTAFDITGIKISKARMDAMLAQLKSVQDAQVWVFDGWDEKKQKASVEVFASKEAADAYDIRWTRKHPFSFAGVVKRKVKE